MGKKSNLSPEKRQSIVTLRGEGYSFREIAKKVTVSYTAVRSAIVRYNETGKNNDRARKGRPKATSKSQDKFIRVTSLRNRRLTANEIAAQVSEAGEANVSATTVRRRLIAAGLNGRCAARKPLLRPVNKRKRLIWAKQHQNWTVDQWKRVLWTDESKFEIFGSRRRVYVRRRIGERLTPECIVPTVKHGGGAVMLWGCFAGNSAGDIHRVTGILNQNGYHSILQRHAIPSGTRLIGDNFVLMQDNDPKHTSKLCKNYLQKKMDEKKLTVMEWPAQSPDCNPIELVWDELDRRVKKRQPSSADTLWTLLQEEWQNITGEYLLSLVERMPRVCSAVIKAKGGYFEESKI